MFGQLPDYQRAPYFGEFDGYADLYLLLDIDLPFVDDGLRVYAQASDRKRFFDLCEKELQQRAVRFALIKGRGDARFAAAKAAICP